MSLPNFPKPSSILSRDQALDAILASIAMEEAALSHIINAEGEKIQYILKFAKENKADVCDILKVNESVSSVLEHVNDMQVILKNKLHLALKYLPKPPCPEPKPPCPEPKPPCQKPKPPCQKPKPPCHRPKPPYSCQKPPYSCQKLPYSCQKPPYSCQKSPYSCQKPPYSCQTTPCSRPRFLY